MRFKMLIVLSVFLFGLIMPFHASDAAESKLLKEAGDTLTKTSESLKNVNQKLAVSNALSALDAAQAALKKGDENEAKKKKRESLKWLVQAVRECMDPGTAPGKISDALKEEGAMSEMGQSRFNTLMNALVNGKKKKKASDFPIFEGMALNQIVLALNEVIDWGGDGFHPNKALKWYLNAAASCEDVQDLINELLDYMHEHADLTGINDMSDEGYQKAKEMVDELYKMKEKGASPDEIIDFAEKIKKFLEEDGTKVGRARMAELIKKGEEGEAKKEETVQSAPVTTVTFTALDGDTNINKDYLGEVETIQFLAVDDTEIDPKEVDPDIAGHNDSFTISVGKAAKIGSIVLVGTAGIIKLVQDGSGGASSTFKGIEPKDGSIDLRNGRMNETLNVKRGIPDMAYAPQDHAVTIDGNPVRVIATRADQIAVQGDNISVSLGGESQVEITSPSETILSDKCPTWGYNISLPQAVKINVWIPIMAEVFGLSPTEKVSFHFMPAPGQEIMPTDITIPAADLVFPPSTVAELKVLTPGPQGLDVVVTRETD
ncbi:MAG: hypothetical protein JW743_06900 [Deltaproteobacteria bacterium]|nr:hypothetical protein [Deltaproteobacteria bacterium]MBN2844799.1 hypothetical protein [Deltaproteobacteria bacterium]